MIRITLIIITLITPVLLAVSRDITTRATADLPVRSRPAPPSTKQIDIFGQKINYIEAGSGPNVILLHGLGDDLNVWEQTVPALAPKYRVWALDQIGFGGSDKPFINYRVSVFVEYLHAFCKKLGVEKATLVGNSLGGWVAAAFASAYPEKVEKLVLVGSAGYWPKHERRFPRSEILQHFQVRFHRFCSGNRKIRRQNVDQFIRQYPSLTNLFLGRFVNRYRC